jgi:hypothetical protein
MGECCEEPITVGLLSPPFYPGPQAIIKKHLIVYFACPFDLDFPDQDAIFHFLLDIFFVLW